MKFTPTILALGFITAALAAPAQEAAKDYQTAHFQFNGEEAEHYKLNVTTNGKTFKTKSTMAVNYINIDDFNADRQCVFMGANNKKLSPDFDPNDQTGKQRLVFKQPTEVVSVLCEGTCLGIYSDCYDIHQHPLGSCCNGICAANKCRPWNTGTA